MRAQPALTQAMGQAVPQAVSEDEEAQTPDKCVLALPGCAIAGGGIGWDG